MKQIRAEHSLYLFSVSCHLDCRVKRRETLTTPLMMMEVPGTKLVSLRQVQQTTALAEDARQRGN